MSDNSLPVSQERLLDAEEIDALLAKEGVIQRPSVRAHLESLAQKIRRDANALKRMEASQIKSNENISSTNVEVDADPAAEFAASSETKTVEPVSSAPPAMTVPVVVVASPPTPVDVTVNAAPPKVSLSMKYKPIDKFSFDAGSYNSPSVTIYIMLSNIGTLPKSQIHCSFTKTSFDLTVSDFDGANYRLLKDNLEHEINPEESKMKIKANKIIIKLQKVKSEYGSYDSWNELTSKKSKTEAKKKKDNPASSIMDLMKDMYDSGDDNMKKMIGETMTKQREGKLGNGLDQGMDDLKF